MGMLGLRCLVGLCLFAAPWARAQRVAIPVEGLGRTILAAPAPVLYATPMLAPSALSAPTPFVPSAPLLAAPAPAPVKLAAVNAAVAQFATLDLKSAPAAELRDGADTLMSRVLGGETSEAPAILRPPRLALAEP